MYGNIVYIPILFPAAVLNSDTFLREELLWFRGGHYRVSGRKLNFCALENSKSQIFWDESGTFHCSGYGSYPEINIVPLISGTCIVTSYLLY